MRTAKATKNGSANRVKDVIAKSETVKILPLDKRKMVVTVVGETDYLSHRICPSVTEGITAKQQGKVIEKVRLTPEEEYLSSLHVINPKKKMYGAPCSGFRLGIVGACGKDFPGNLSKIGSRGSIFIYGEDCPNLCTIKKAKPFMFSHPVRIPKTGSIIERHRACFPAGWEITMIVEYDASVVTAEQIVNLINRVGFSFGLGDWRAQKDGVFGKYSVKATK